MKKLNQYQLNFVTLNNVIFNMIPSQLKPEYANDFVGCSGPHYFVLEEGCGVESLSTSWQMDMIARLRTVKTFSIRNNQVIVDAFLEYDNRINSVSVFKFGDELREDKDRAQQALQVLKFGFILVHKDGSYTEYERYLRSPSGLRAGGALFCKRGERFQLRNIISLGMIEKLQDTKISFVPTKWESALSLSITSSHAITAERDWNIRIVPDFQRQVKVKVKKLAEYTDAELEDLKKKGINPNPKKYQGLDRLKYNVLSDEPNDIEFELLENIYETREIEAIDGCGIGSFKLFEHIFDILQLTEEEREYAYVQQIRAPFVKGMLCGADIVALADELNITTLVDIYGEEFDPRDCDMLLPESMFKGSGLFKSISEYLEAMNTPFEYDGRMFEQFPKHQWLRVANVNKAKEPMREMTYQYLQAMQELNPNALIDLARPFVETVRAGVTKDIAVAKKFLGMVYHGDEGYNKSMVGKAQEMLEICPALFYHPSVQRQLIDTVETSFWNLTKGRIPVFGAYHFIVGDLTLLFANTKERYDKKGNDTNLDGSEFCFLKKGENYMPRFEGEMMSYRSPLIHASEVRKIKFTKNAFGDRHFGHLKGLTMLNSYEPTALCMGGADYDGDKIFETEDEMLKKAYVPDMAIIISPLETYKAPKVLINDIETEQSLFKIDERTMDNQTGVFTDMGTYYTGEFYHTRLQYMTAIKAVQNAQNQQQLIDVMNSMCWKRRGEIQSVQNLLRILNEDMHSKLAEIDYKLTVIRICQAGEIDFPKHGVRFVMPKNCVTSGVTKWLKPDRFKEMNLRRENFNKENAQEIAMGIKVAKKPVVAFDTPLQRLYDACVAEWGSIKETLKQQTYDTNKYLMGVNIDKAEFNRLYPTVKAIEAEYSQKLYALKEEIKAKGYNTEQAMKLYRAHFDDFIDRTEVLTTDRKSLASVCCHITFVEKSNNYGTSFPFVVAYDGILQNLAEYNFNSLRIIPVKELDHDVMIHSGSLIIKDNVATHNVTGRSFDFDVEMPDGIYSVFAVKGKHYIQVPYTMTSDDKERLVNHYYRRIQDSDITGKEKLVHTVSAVKNVNYDFAVNGLKFYNQTSDSAIALLNAYKKFKLVPVEVKAGIEYLGVQVNDTVIGTIARKDKTKVKNNEFLNLDEFVGHILKVAEITSSGKSAINIKGFITTNVIAKEYELDKYHAQCDMTKWYWNREWVKISQFQGFKFVNVEFSNYKPAVGEIFSRVNLEVNGVLHHVYIQRIDNGISINSIVNSLDNSQIELERVITNELGEQIVISNIHEDLVAGILRACSYFNAKKIVMDLEKEQEEKKQAELEEQLSKDLLIELNKAFNNGVDRLVLETQIAF